MAIQMCKETMLLTQRLNKNSVYLNRVYPVYNSINNLSYYINNNSTSLHMHNNKTYTCMIGV